MSRLLDSKPRLLTSSKGNSKTASFLSSDVQKYEVIRESGVARNLDRLNLKNSIYDEEE